MSNEREGRPVLQAAEFAAFDLLPARLRDVLRYACFKYSAMDCFAALSAGMPAEAIAQEVRRRDAQLGHDYGRPS